MTNDFNPTIQFSYGRLSSSVTFHRSCRRRRPQEIFEFFSYYRHQFSHQLSSCYPLLTPVLILIEPSWYRTIFNFTRFEIALKRFNLIIRKKDDNNITVVNVLNSIVSLRVSTPAYFFSIPFLSSPPLPWSTFNPAIKDQTPSSKNFLVTPLSKLHVNGTFFFSFNLTL